MAANPVPPVRLLTLDMRKSGDTVTVLCHGKLVAESSSILRDEARTLVAQFKVIVLDLTDLSYMDSAGLGTLVGLYVSAKRGGAQLKLINLTDRIKELLNITHLSSVFEGYGEYL